MLGGVQPSQHLPIVWPGGWWLRYEGHCLSGVVSEFVGQRNGGGGPRLLRHVLTGQLYRGTKVAGESELCVSTVKRTCLHFF